MTARVLALDVSLTKTGACTPDGRLTTMRPPKGAIGGERLAWYSTQFGLLLRNERPHRLVIEAPIPGNRDRGNSARKLAELYGILWAEIHRYGPVVVSLVPANTLKKQATGNGRADKDQMRSAAMAACIHDDGPAYDMVKAANDDEIDAWWLFTLAHNGRLE